MTRTSITCLAALVALVATGCASAATDTAASTTSSPSPTSETLASTPSPGLPAPTPSATSPEPTATAEATPPPAEPTVQTVALSDPISHVHGLVVDADGALRAGTHDGVRVIGLDGTVTAVGPRDDLMGMTGEPGTMRLISSGHPGPGSQFPNPVGLISSGDGGATWTAESLTGQIDFHALATTGDLVVGFDGVTGIVTSTDGGVTWKQGAAIAAASLALVGKQVWATTPEGLMHSTDRGATFSPLSDAPALWLVSSGTDGSLWGVDVDGRAWRSHDGLDWARHKKLPAIDAIAALDHHTAYAVNDSELVILAG